MANDCSKSAIPSHLQCLLVVGCCWLTIWDSSKHMKIGSYISHRQIRWNLLLIMLLIPELYRAHTETVFQTGAGKNQTVKENVCPRWACNYLQKHINKGNKHWEEKGEQWEGNNNNIYSITHVTELSLVQTDIHPSHKKKEKKKKRTPPSKLNMIFDFGVGGLRIKWCILTMLNEIQGRKECRPTYVACCALACQPPTDLAINLQYKRSLISGSLILK